MRYRNFVLLLAVLFLIACSSKLSTDTASSVIESAFKLSDNDELKILGTTEETKGTVIVKFQLNDKTMSVKLRKYDQGWQLEEIQNELGSWIPATTIINALDEASKVKTARAEIGIISSAIADYVTDKATPPSASGSYDETSQLYKSLCPFYVKKLPIKDPWGNNYLVYCGTAVDGQYGISGGASDDFLVVSHGKGGERETWTYNPSAPDSGLYTDKDDTKDLVNLNGSFIRGPRAGVWD